VSAACDREPARSGLPRIRASADQLKQVLLNLLLNAATRCRKRDITVATHAGAGAETELFGRDAVQIQVRDTGDGIPDELIAQIFEPFLLRRNPGKGTGLGLWVSQASCKAMAGPCACAAVVGRGTTFMITLPVEGRRAMREQPKVLVVDDEESVVVTIKAILQLDGYNVATTTSGAKARAMVREANTTSCSPTSASKTATAWTCSRRSASDTRDGHDHAHRLRVARICHPGSPCGGL